MALSPVKKPTARTAQTVSESGIPTAAELAKQMTEAFNKQQSVAQERVEFAQQEAQEVVPALTSDYNYQMQTLNSVAGQLASQLEMKNSEIQEAASDTLRPVKRLFNPEIKSEDDLKKEKLLIRNNLSNTIRAMEAHDREYNNTMQQFGLKLAGIESEAEAYKKIADNVHVFAKQTQELYKLQNDQITDILSGYTYERLKELKANPESSPVPLGALEANIRETERLIAAASELQQKINEDTSKARKTSLEEDLKLIELKDSVLTQAAKTMSTSELVRLGSEIQESAAGKTTLTLPGMNNPIAISRQDLANMQSIREKHQSETATLDAGIEFTAIQLTEAISGFNRVSAAGDDLSYKELELSARAVSMQSQINGYLSNGEVPNPVLVNAAAQTAKALGEAKIEREKSYAALYPEKQKVQRNQYINSHRISKQTAMSNIATLATLDDGALAITNPWLSTLISELSTAVQDNLRNVYESGADDFGTSEKLSTADFLSALKSGSLKVDPTIVQAAVNDAVIGGKVIDPTTNKVVKSSFVGRIGEKMLEDYITYIGQTEGFAKNYPAIWDTQSGKVRSMRSGFDLINGMIKQKATESPGEPSEAAEFLSAVNNPENISAYLNIVNKRLATNNFTEAYVFGLLADGNHGEVFKGILASQFSPDTIVESVNTLSSNMQLKKTASDYNATHPFMYAVEIAKTIQKEGFSTLGVLEGLGVHSLNTVESFFLSSKEEGTTESRAALENTVRAEADKLNALLGVTVQIEEQGE